MRIEDECGTTYRHFGCFPRTCVWAMSHMTVIQYRTMPIWRFMCLVCVQRYFHLLVAIVLQWYIIVIFEKGWFVWIYNTLYMLLNTVTTFQTQLIWAEYGFSRNIILGNHENQNIITTQVILNVCNGILLLNCAWATMQDN